MTWDNAALMSPTTSQRMKIDTGDLIEISHRGKKVTAPVWILPGHADDSVTLPLGETLFDQKLRPCHERGAHFSAESHQAARSITGDQLLVPGL